MLSIALQSPELKAQTLFSHVFFKNNTNLLIGLMIFCYIVLPLTGMSKNCFNPQTTYTEKNCRKKYFSKDALNGKMKTGHMW